MRIISGAFKGRKIFSPPKNIEVRPTTDKVREALFDIIRFDLREKRFLDLYSGSGAIGIEAISEGASFACFVEEDKKAFKVILKNLEDLNLIDKTKVENKDVLKFINSFKTLNSNKEFCCFDFIFMDPPYQSNLAILTLEALVNSFLIFENTIVVVEHSTKFAMNDNITGAYWRLEKIKQKKYGEINLTFYDIYSVSELKQD